MEFKFKKTPKNVSVIGNFDDDCTINLHAKTLEALKSGALKINIRHMGGRAKICAFRPYFGAIRGNINISVGNDNADVTFANGCAGNYTLTLWRIAKVHIGARTTSNGMRVFCADSEFVTGSDCMFSDNILIQSSDQHGIVDLSSGELLNTFVRKIVLEDHVWLGRSSILMPDVTVGKGAIVGTGAVVTSDVLPTTIVAGVPARVVKSNVTWSRSVTELDEFSTTLVEEHQSKSVSNE